MNMYSIFHTQKIDKELQKLDEIKERLEEYYEVIKEAIKQHGESGHV